jgi:hypothetical protein
MTLLSSSVRRSAGLCFVAATAVIFGACKTTNQQSIVSSEEGGQASAVLSDNITEHKTPENDPTFAGGVLGGEGQDLAQQCGLLLGDVAAGDGGGLGLTAQGRNDCVELNDYMHAAYRELYNKCRNYCFADDHCYNRAVMMLARTATIAAPDLRGPDGKWCAPEDVGTGRKEPDTASCDDLAFKVYVRYASGSWSYHIASFIKKCEPDNKFSFCGIDPISKDLRCRTPEAWCKAWAHNPINWADADDAPTGGKDTCEVGPATQHWYPSASYADPLEMVKTDGIERELRTHTEGLCAAGREPFPAGCDRDKDDDGVPDALDKCASTPAAVRASVNYVTAARLGCAETETP